MTKRSKSTLDFFLLPKQKYFLLMFLSFLLYCWFFWSRFKPKKKDLLKFWHIQDNTCEIFDNISYLSHIFTEGRDSDGHTSGLAVLAILVVMFTDIERIPVSHHLHWNISPWKWSILKDMLQTTPPFQFTGCFVFSRYTVFMTYLDISYIYLGA